MKKFDQDKALLDVEAAVKAAAEGGKVGITGYCFGGRITWRAAAEGIGLTAASGYYGGGVPDYIDLEPKIPLEMHYGSKDKGIPLEQVEELKKRHPEVDIYVYDGDHGFCNSDRPTNFDEAVVHQGFGAEPRLLPQAPRVNLGAHLSYLEAEFAAAKAAPLSLAQGDAGRAC